MTSDEIKTRQRRVMLDRIRALPRDLRAARSESLAARLLSHPALAGTRPGYVLAFAALPSEPDLRSLAVRAPHVRFCLPRVAEANSLTVHHVPDFEHLVLSEKRIGEPHPRRHPEIALGDIATILVPGLAFSTGSGHRLGRGGGYYDRFLARPELARALRIAVCFDEQAIPEVPSESHDCRVHEIMTDRRWLRIGNPGG